ncbi:MAG: LysR family transcriptional regulator, partial [Dinoroseobacter sp.]|nr:LysR family transcriptional regulator [Dinoroseobacter sp.]
MASAGGFTAAARERNVSQSTLSVQVGRLEKSYGCRLFLRRGRSIELTEIGRALYSHTTRQFEAEQDAEALLRGDQAGLSG